MTDFKRPKVNILGIDVSGEVESLGENVTKFKVGDVIYGVKGPKPGTKAEYCCISEEWVAKKPVNMSNAETAAVPNTPCTALIGLKDKVGIQERQKAFIYGASGSVGTFAIQIAKLFTSDGNAV